MTRQPITLAFASGKGGTGKTMLSTSAAWLASQKPDANVLYIDADVEEPNGHLFLNPEITDQTRFSVPVPVQVPGRCTGCKLCQQSCEFHAIMVAGTRVIVFPELCHSCGVCTMVCPENALTEEPRELGSIETGVAGPIRFRAGRLDVGEARATPLVEAAVRPEPSDADMLMVDCPPGTSCPAMAAVEHADLVVLVTEPTPFGLHDLTLAVGMCRELNRDIVAIINRADLGDDRVIRYLEEEHIPILASIPFDRDIATAYAEGHIAAQHSAAVRDAAQAVLQRASEISR